MPKGMPKGIQNRIMPKGTMPNGKNAKRNPKQNAKRNVERNAKRNVERNATGIMPKGCYRNKKKGPKIDHRPP